MPAIKTTGERRIKEVTDISGSGGGDPRKFALGDIIFVRTGDPPVETFKRRNDTAYSAAAGGNHDDCWTTIPLGQWTENSGKIYYSGGNVGIGDNNPSEKLTVGGNIRATTGSNILMLDVDGSNKGNAGLWSEGSHLVLGSKTTNDLLIFV